MRMSFSKYANELETMLVQSEAKQEVIQVSWQLLQEKFEDLKNVNSEIFELLLTQDASEEDLYAEQESCDVYSERLKTLNFRCEKLFRQESELVSETNGAEVTTGTGKRNFQLPVIQFKKFDGNIRNWLPFWAQFKKVHEDISIDCADKVDYLVQATVPGSRARQLIESFPATGEHYPQIIDSLKSRFGRNDLQIEVYVRELSVC